LGSDPKPLFHRLKIGLKGNVCEGAERPQSSSLGERRRHDYKSPMRRASPLLIRLLALLLLLQSGMAMAHCLRGTAGTWLAEICTAEGMRMARLDGDGNEMPPAAEPAAFCPVCHGLPAIAAPPAPTAFMPVSYATAIGWTPGADGTATPPARAPPYTGRAPPLPH
jgi:hypothetical protein